MYTWLIFNYGKTGRSKELRYSVLEGSNIREKKKLKLKVGSTVIHTPFF